MTSTTTAAPVRYHVDGGVGAIVLDRASASNALDHTMKKELLNALVAARTDEHVRAVSITAAAKTSPSTSRRCTPIPPTPWTPCASTTTQSSSPCTT
jgi:1,4-dihydroxy-2-naphthoyl-CoA synthase